MYLIFLTQTLLMLAMIPIPDLFYSISRSWNEFSFILVSGLKCLKVLTIFWSNVLNFFWIDRYEKNNQTHKAFCVLRNFFYNENFFTMKIFLQIHPSHIFVSKEYQRNLLIMNLEIIMMQIKSGHNNISKLAVKYFLISSNLLLMGDA